MLTLRVPGMKKSKNLNRSILCYIIKISFERKRQVICWIENHFKKIDNYIEN